MPSEYELMKKRERLVRRIHENMDFLIGSVSTKGLKYPAYNLTAKVDGVTKTRHIPKDMLSVVRRLVARHQTLKRLLKELADVNWKLISQGGDLNNSGTF